MSNSANDGYIHNIRLESQFTTTCNSSASDSRLSFAARGLLWYLVSRPSNWKIHRSQLAKQYTGKERGNGRDAVDKMMRELIRYGYVVYKKTKSKEGYWVHSYNVYPMPVGKYEEIKIKIPHTVKPRTVNPPYKVINNDNNKNNTPKHKSIKSNSLKTDSPPPPANALVDFFLLKRNEDRKGLGLKEMVAPKSWIDEAKRLLKTRSLDTLQGIILFINKHHYWKDKIKSVTTLRKQIICLEEQYIKQGSEARSNIPRNSAFKAPRTGKQLPNATMLRIAKEKAQKAL
jgi:hypothetical protein